MIRLAVQVRSELLAPTKRYRGKVGAGQRLPPNVKEVAEGEKSSDRRFDVNFAAIVVRVQIVDTGVVVDANVGGKRQIFSLVHNL